LEQNYRSTKTILAAAGGVIRNNLERKDKTLWTENEAGEPVVYYTGMTERDEADFIARESHAWSLPQNTSPPTSSFSTASTPSRACWKKRWCGAESPTTSWAGCDFTSSATSRTCSRIYAFSTTQPMRSAWSGWPECRRAESARRRSK